ncbi:hypothetical protein [Kitasatospora sp. McL0602]|uniref:hypothetical protein n=1 Tax=Kitasatospora sp. McL0602 TaxID=3439530 RepID=UPI003F8B816A
MEYRALVVGVEGKATDPAAGHADEPADDGRLSLAVHQVLRGFADGRLPLDGTWEYLPIERFCREVAGRVAQLGAGKAQQQVPLPLAALGRELTGLLLDALDEAERPAPDTRPQRVTGPGDPRPGTPLEPSRRAVGEHQSVPPTQTGPARTRMSAAITFD